MSHTSPPGNKKKNFIRDVKSVLYFQLFRVEKLKVIVLNRVISYFVMPTADKSFWPAAFAEI